MKRFSQELERPAWTVFKGLFICVVILAQSSRLIPQPPKEPIDYYRAATLRQIVKKLLDADRVDEAQDRVREEISTRGESAETLFLEAQILFMRKEFKESIKRLKRCLAMEPRDPEVYKLLAFNGVVLDRLDIIEPALKRALQLAPNDTVIHFHLGLLFYTTNRFSMAEGEFQTVVRLDPTNMKGYDMLGLAQQELEDEEAVIETYRRAIELTEQQKLRDDSAYLHLAKFLWSRNRYQESLPLARRAVELNPKSAEAYYVLGRLLDKLGEEKEAVIILQQSTRLDPHYAESRYLLSRIYLRQGHENLALKEMEIFEEIQKASANNRR